MTRHTLSRREHLGVIRTLRHLPEAPAVGSIGPAEQIAAADGLCDHCSAASSERLTQAFGRRDQPAAFLPGDCSTKTKAKLDHDHSARARGR